MMTTRAEFGFPPKKKLTTYGRAGRRLTAANSPSGMSQKATPARQAKPTESATEELGEASTHDTAPHVVSKEARGNASRRNGPSSTVQHQGDLAVKKATTKPAGEDAPRAKKRKVGTTIAADKATTPDPYDIYSPPSSPPMIASSRLNTRPPLAKLASAPAVPLARTSTAASTDRPMEDVYNVEELETPFSSRTSKTLRELSIDNGTREKVQTVPLRLTQKKPPRVPAPRRDPPEAPPRKEPEIKPTVPTRRGKRLIDALAAQVEESSEDEPTSPQEKPFAIGNRSPVMGLGSSPAASQTSQSQPLSEFQSQSLSQSQSQSQAQSQSYPRPRTLPRQVPMTKKSGPRFTYSQQRTMLAEESMLDLAAFGDDDESQKRPAFLGLGTTHSNSNLSAFSFADDEDETANTGMVQSLHELRQAGASNRFSDELNDILDRIGTPSGKPNSLRRGALLELAQKIKEAGFRHQFRNHSSNGDLFKGLEQETDLIAGYAVVSILTTLLATSLTQHLILQIQPKGISHLLLLLLGESSDISVVAKDRKRNASKNAQATLSAVKSAVLQLPIWEPASPTQVSPRTMALKSLDLLMRQLSGSPAESEIFSASLTDRLFEIVSDYGDPCCWNFPTDRESLDFYLALHLLEHHSVSAMQSTTGTRWATEYLPTVAGILGVALQRPVDKFDDLETTTLKLTLNMTNNNHETPAMFVSKGLLRDIAEAACRTFDVVNKSILDDAFLSKVYDSLILMLGVKINFCEHYAPAAQNLMGAGDGEASPLNRLIRVFLDYHAVQADADSMEKTRLNVAFGYLAILLGHLCLHQPIRERFMAIYAKRNLEPLLESIRIFIALHRVTVAAMEGEPSSRPDANAADRLQSLVDQLESHY